MEVNANVLMDNAIAELLLWDVVLVHQLAFQRRKLIHNIFLGRYFIGCWHITLVNMIFHLSYVLFYKSLNDHIASAMGNVTDLWRPR